MTLETGEGEKRSHILALSAKGARGRSWPSGGGLVDLFSRTQTAQALPSSQLRETRSLRISLGPQPRLLLTACPPEHLAHTGLGSMGLLSREPPPGLRPRQWWEPHTEGGIPSTGLQQHLSQHLASSQAQQLPVYGSPAPVRADPLVQPAPQ